MSIPKARKKLKYYTRSEQNDIIHYLKDKQVLWPEQNQ